MSNAPETKYTDRDVRENPELIQVAEEYLLRYEGEFSFLIDCKMRMANGMSLSTGHIRGILNCMRVDPRVHGLPEPLPPDDIVVEFVPRKQRQARKSLVPCDIEEFHGRHGGAYDDDPYQYCSGKFEINRTERNVPMPVTLKPEIKYITAQSPTGLMHLPLLGGDHYANWLPKQHEWGYHFRPQKYRFWDDSLTYQDREVPMVDLHIYTDCTFPRNIKNPFMLTQEQYDAVQSDEEFCRPRCGRCFK